jgi:Fic-DOC domain mobile mystery protein B
MTIKFEYAVGATPLDPDELNGLIPLHITIQSQLNEWEANNILEAEQWLYSTNHRGDLHSIDFIKRVHKKMFNKTWRWAGQFRNTGRNIGVDWYQINTVLADLLHDVRYQIINKSYVFDEIAYRFHHRLVAIHPFPNGNGRHARLMTDFLLEKAGLPRFTWGRTNLTNSGATRKEYISALRSADRGDYAPLASFVRS